MIYINQLWVSEQPGLAHPKGVFYFEIYGRTVWTPHAPNQILALPKHLSLLHVPYYRVIDAILSNGTDRAINFHWDCCHLHLQIRILHLLAFDAMKHAEDHIFIEIFEIIYLDSIN